MSKSFSGGRVQYMISPPPSRLTVQLVQSMILQPAPHEETVIYNGVIIDVQLHISGPENTIGPQVLSASAVRGLNQSNAPPEG